MDIPLLEEKRELRAEFNAAYRAMQLQYLVNGALTQVAVIERELQLNALQSPEVPGDDVVDTLSKLNGPLQGLRESGPQQGDDLAVSLAKRRAQLQLAAKELKPLAAKYDEFNKQLGELHDRQRALLAEPEWAEIKEKLDKLHHERHTAGIQLGELKQRTVILKSTYDATRNAWNQVISSLRQAKQSDPGGFLTWQAAKMAEALAESLSWGMGEMSADIGEVTPPKVPEEPSIEERETLHTETERFLEQLEGICAKIQETMTEVTAQVTELDERYRALDAELLSYIG